MVSRRQLLGATAVGCVGLAGCSGSNSSSKADCTTAVVNHGDGTLLDGGAMVAIGDSGGVILQIPLQADQIEQSGVNLLRVQNADGDLLFEIPIEKGQKTYEQYLSRRP